MDRIDASSAPRSQSRLSPVLLWVLLAAALFRIVTAVMERPGVEGVGLVRWQAHANATALSRTSGKPVLYEFSAAWCGPCKLLDREWEDPEIAAKVNRSYVPARVIDRQREDGSNTPEVADLQRRFEIAGFPALVAATPDGRLLGKLEGYGGRARLEKFLENPAAP